MAPAPGSPFGRYLLGERLAVGGMGEVYLAVQRGLGNFERVLALKLLLPHLDEDAAAVQMFIEEATLVARMQHPSVVQIFDVGQEGGRYFIAMELVRGVSLARLISELAARGERLDADCLLLVARSLCDGLHHAHELKGTDGVALEVVHRDVSPQNVLVSTGGEVKLTDFGIAKARDSRGKTRPGAVKGKLEYVAPEQIEGGRIDRRADLYSTAVLLYQLAILRSPFERESDAATLRAVSEGALPPLSMLRPELPEALVAAIHKAASKEPSARFTTALEMRDALPTPSATAAERLGRLVRELGADVLGELHRKSTRLTMAARSMEHAPIRRRRLWLLGSGSLIAVSLAVGAALRREPAPAAPVAEAAPPAPPLLAPQPAVVKPIEEAPPVQKEAPRPTPPRPSKEVGFLTVDAEPWAVVTVDGKKLGETPIAGYPLKAGTVSVRFDNPETGKSRTRRVKIVPGRRHYVQESLR